MKTHKKLLTLVLVLALAAALAAPAFAIRRQLSFWPDADLFDEEYKQAAEVMVYHGIIEGDEGGMRPLDTITRAEACKIITFMLEGPEAGEMEEAGVTFPFEVRMTIRLVDREDPARVFTDSSVTIVVDPASYGHGIG